MRSTENCEGKENDYEWSYRGWNFSQSPQKVKHKHIAQTLIQTTSSVHDTVNTVI
jgi:hypothetical protein